MLLRNVPVTDRRCLVDVLAEDGMRLTGALATHYHPDHVGGEIVVLGEVADAALVEKAARKLVA